LRPDQMQRLGDDRLGRALDQLFDADRAALLTDVVIAVGRHFDLRFAEFHNDSTSIRFCGQYRGASGRAIRGRTAPAITYGYSRDHRPDLKQLLFILTVDADGHVPVHFRCADGNTSDSITHIESWEALRTIAGRADFLYVADSKLCSRENMAHIDRAGGRFVTVMPRSRAEDAQFRRGIQTRTPDWELVWDRPNPEGDGPRDRWYVYRDPIPSGEVYTIVWVWSTLLTLSHEARRRKNIAAATEKLVGLRERLRSPKTRLRSAVQIDQEIADIVAEHQVGRFLKVRRRMRQEHEFKQTRRGRPGPDTVYRKITHRRFDVEWTVDEKAVAYAQKSDGMYPLMSNDRGLTAAQVLEAHKSQPMIEKRFQQLKSEHEIAPVFLKDEGRIEAFFTLYFLALLVQALIERELRQAMQREKIAELPIYPEQRMCLRPSGEQILRLFSHIERRAITMDGQVARAFDPDLTSLQVQVLSLLGVPIQGAYRILP
jgi:transposase